MSWCRNERDDHPSLLYDAGGKDSTVLAYLMALLNKRHTYGLDLHLLSVDEGIKGYRDDSLETVARNEKQYGIPLTVVSYKGSKGVHPQSL